MGQRTQFVVEVVTTAFAVVVDGDVDGEDVGDTKRSTDSAFEVGFTGITFLGGYHSRTAAALR